MFYGFVHSGNNCSTSGNFNKMVNANLIYVRMIAQCIITVRLQIDVTEIKRSTIKISLH